MATNNAKESINQCLLSDKSDQDTDKKIKIILEIDKF